MTFNKTEIRGISMVLVIIVAIFVIMKLVNGTPTAPEAAEEGTEIVELPTGTTTSSQALAEALAGGLTNRGEVTELFVQDVREGSGEAVEHGSVVTIHYRGVLTDGTEFDNSHAKEQPLTFTVGAGDVIEGLEKGLLGLKAGGSRILVIPADMAYKNNSLGLIPPRAALLFAVELLEVQ